MAVSNLISAFGAGRKLMTLILTRKASTVRLCSSATHILTSLAGNLKNIWTLFPVDIKRAITDCNVVPNDQIAPAASFINACLRLNPKERPSAEELTFHDWVKDAYACSDTGDEYEFVANYGMPPMDEEPGAPKDLRGIRLLNVLWIGICSLCNCALLVNPRDDLFYAKELASTVTKVSRSFSFMSGVSNRWALRV